MSWDLYAHGDTRSFPGLADEQLRLARWWAAAREAGIEDVLIAFKASRDQPERLPGTAQYRRAVESTLNRLDLAGYRPMIRAISAWNEPNLSAATSDSPLQAGRFFSVVRQLCIRRGCQALAGDFLDSRFTAAYLREYLKGSGKPAPLQWAWHAYADGGDHDQHDPMARLQAFIALLPANSSVRLTEQGGLVRLPGGLQRGQDAAASDLAFLLAQSRRPQNRVVGFDVYQWQGEAPPLWDSGLISPGSETRPGYCVFAAAVAATELSPFGPLPDQPTTTFPNPLAWASNDPACQLRRRYDEASRPNVSRSRR